MTKSRGHGDSPLGGSLDRDLDARLFAPQDGDEELIARVRDRVMTAIASQATAPHVTVRADDGWESLCQGVERKVLRDADGMRSCLMRLAPGVRIPGHFHAVDEECVVIEGSFRLGDLHLHAGDYHMGRRGMDHEEAVTEEGVVVYLRGTVEQFS